MEKKELDQILSIIARQNNTTVKQVREDIMIALDEGRKSPDPNIQAAWSSIPCQGPVPTLEEVMEYLIHRLRNP